MRVTRLDKLIANHLAALLEAAEISTVIQPMRGFHVGLDPPPESRITAELATLRVSLLVLFVSWHAGLPPLRRCYIPIIQDCETDFGRLAPPGVAWLPRGGRPTARSTRSARARTGLRSAHLPPAANRQRFQMDFWRSDSHWGRTPRSNCYFGITSRANLLATNSRISVRFFPASTMASREP